MNPNPKEEESQKGPADSTARHHAVSCQYRPIQA
jgi:hypothetical protein